MARRRHGLNGPAVAADVLTILERNVRTEIAVGTGIERIELADMQGPRRTMWTLGTDGRTRSRLDGWHGRRMIPMGVGDENMRHRLAAYGVEQRTDMRRIIGTRIDDGDFSAAEDIAHGSLEGEWTRVVGHHSPHARHRLVDHVRRKLEILVERNVVVHAWPGNGSVDFGFGHRAEWREKIEIAALVGLPDVL